MPTPKKADAATVKLRVEEVFRIVLDGAQFHDVVQYAADKGWGLKERQVREYISKANDLMVVRQKDSRRKLLARHLARREALYARCVNGADYRTALAVLADMAKLRGLYPEPKDRKPPPAADRVVVENDGPTPDAPPGDGGGDG